MSTNSFFDHLFQHAQQVTPYLAGKVESLPVDLQSERLIHISQPCSEQIEQLYLSLKSAHPEAGSAYWLTRTWTLLCWQPVYVAFISIYACQGLPHLTQMAQQVQERFIGGFQFEEDEVRTGTSEALIELAGRELMVLFDHYRQEMNQWTRIRPGFTKHLIADGILGSIVRLHQFAPDLSHDYLRQQAQLWLKACNLPDKLVATLHSDQQDGHLKLVRTSCCLVYKCAGRELCSDCPRHPENKKVLTV